MISPYSIKNFIKILIPNSILTHRLPRQSGGSVLLTFDDGPDPDITLQILEILKKYKIRAVFFVVGKKIEEAPHVFDRILSDGHVIGNHTYSHPNYIITSAEEYQNEILQCNKVIESRGGGTPQLIRPPLGISPATLRVAISIRKKIILWSIEGGEWGIHKQDSTEKIISRLKKNLNSRDIILLHDDNPKTPQILNAILPFLKQKKTDLTGGANLLI